MHTEFSRRAVRVAALIAGSLILPHLALAQEMVGGLPLHPGGLFKPRQQQQTNEAPPPSALPGAESQGTAAPATENPEDMSPNAALFDAINRDDIAGVRDALNRGAILSAHNSLDLTPIELAVDLGYHNILFLLLSVRGADSGGTPSAAPAPGMQQAAAKPAPSSARPVQPAKLATRKRVPVTAPAAVPPQPNLVANDGGSPIPSIGFLGFGTPHGSP